MRLQLSEVISLVQLRNTFFLFHFYIIILILGMTRFVVKRDLISSISGRFHAVAHALKCSISVTNLHTDATCGACDCVKKLAACGLAAIF